VDQRLSSPNLPVTRRLFVSGLAAAGLTNLRIHDYLAAKVQGITPEFAQRIRSHGLKDLTIHQLISLKVAGIS